MFTISRLAAAALATALTAPVAHAATTFVGEVTGDTIFGNGGNTNRGFTVTQENGIELGLRAKVRYPSASDSIAALGNGGTSSVYTQQAGAVGTSFRPTWAFDWSINSDWENGAVKLGAYDYRISLDVDPDGAGTTFYSTLYGQDDPVNFSGTPTPDHSFGNNSTGANAGTERVNFNVLSEYQDLVDGNNLVQNTFNYSFMFSDLSVFDPSRNGVYTIKLEAFEKGTSNLLASSSIDVNVVPLPAGALLIGTAFLGAGAVRRWGRRAA